MSSMSSVSPSAVRAPRPRGVAMSAGRAAAQDLTIAAASDLQVGAARRSPPATRSDTGQKADVTFGSSGNFFTQIQNGAPFDVFFSADIDYPHQLESRGARGTGQRRRVRHRADRCCGPGTTGRSTSRGGLAVLADAAVRRVAIANPEHAPYGRAAVAALRHAGCTSACSDKLVFGENISQAAQFAQSGNAEAGILALSLAIAPAHRRTRDRASRFRRLSSADSPGRGRHRGLATARTPRGAFLAVHASSRPPCDIAAVLRLRRTHAHRRSMSARPA